MITELEMSALSSSKLRYNEAKYFLEQFITNCGPPIDSYPLMICYLDAFLFCLISIEELVTNQDKDKLRSNNAFRFLKALRNITSHHSVLGATLYDSKFRRPFSREVNVSIGGPQNDSSRLKLHFDVLRTIFDSVEKERPTEHKTLQGARDFLTSLESEGKDALYIEKIMQDGLKFVKQVLENNA